MEIDPGEGLHYLDNASTTFPKPAQVLQAMTDFATSAGVSPGRSAFDLAMVAEAMVDGCRKAICGLFRGPHPERVVFGHNATDALNLVIFGLLQDGGHVVSTRLEHNSVLRPIAHCVDEHGARATLVPFDGRGYVDPDDVRKAIEKDTRLVVLNHASNVIGTVQPVAAIGAVCRAAGVPLCLDAAQSAGVVPIDMRAMHVDVVAFTGHAERASGPPRAGIPRSFRSASSTARPTRWESPAWRADSPSSPSTAASLRCWPVRWNSRGCSGRHSARPTV